MLDDEGSADGVAAEDADEDKLDKEPEVEDAALEVSTAVVCES